MTAKIKAAPDTEFEAAFKVNQQTHNKARLPIAQLRKRFAIWRYNTGLLTFEATCAAFGAHPEWSNK